MFRTPIQTKTQSIQAKTGKNYYPSILLLAPVFVRADQRRLTLKSNLAKASLVSTALMPGWLDLIGEMLGWWQVGIL